MACAATERPVAACRCGDAMPHRDSTLHLSTITRCRAACFPTVDSMERRSTSESACTHCPSDARARAKLLFPHPGKPTSVSSRGALPAEDGMACQQRAGDP